ncbi:RnfABCDGE type electron transport complex subunit G [Vibrio sp. PP-XX7]
MQQGQDRLEKWKTLIRYQTGLLALTCGIAAMLLISMEGITRPVIHQRVAEDQHVLLNEVLAGKTYANDVLAHPQFITYQGQTYQMFAVKNVQGEIIAHVVQGVVAGYGGPIQYLMGVDLDGVIQGVRIISHSETPGLGDKIELAKSQWILSFNHRSLTNTPLWAVKKDGGDFDQFSGATITPRSVVKGVHDAMLALTQALASVEK